MRDSADGGALRGILDTPGRKRNRDVADAMDPSGTLFGKRNLAMTDAMDTPGDLDVTQDTRCRVSDPDLAFAVD